MAVYCKKSPGPNVNSARFGVAGVYGVSAPKEVALDPFSASARRIAVSPRVPLLSVSPSTGPVESSITATSFTTDWSCPPRSPHSTNSCSLSAKTHPCDLIRARVSSLRRRHLPPGRRAWPCCGRARCALPSQHPNGHAAKGVLGERSHLRPQVDTPPAGGHVMRCHRQATTRVGARQRRAGPENRRIARRNRDDKERRRHLDRLMKALHLWASVAAWDRGESCAGRPPRPISLIRPFRPIGPIRRGGRHGSPARKRGLRHKQLCGR